MAVLEVLRLRSVLQVLLQAVAPLGATDGSDGRLVDDDASVFRCHVGSWLVFSDVGDVVGAVAD